MLTRPSRSLRWLVVVAATVVLAGLAPVTPAAAQDCFFESHTDGNGDAYFVWTCADGRSGGDGDGEWTCHTSLQGDDVQVPCIDSVMGWFTPIHGGCYIKPMTPQPEAGDPAWEGNQPDDGTVYLAYCFGLEGVDGDPFELHDISLFLSSAEDPIGDLIEEAIGRLPLRGPDIHLAPDPDGVGLVGLPVWMWTPPTASTWGPANVELTALGVRVNVRANAEQIRWDMGDGTEVVCGHFGTPYEPRFGAEESPTCGHRYAEPSRSQPDGRYQIAGTTEWLIEWWIEEMAIDGTETATRESSASVRINELQVVTS